MRQIKLGLILATFATVFLGGCGGGGGGGSSSSSGGGANAPPVSNAGPAQTVSSGATVTLNGTGSTDSDGTVAGYAWTQTQGGAVTLSSTSVGQPTFVAPTVTATATFTFSLTVTDNRGATGGASTVTITVNPAPVNVDFTAQVRFARANFNTTGARGLNYGNPAMRPARSVVVRAMTTGSLFLASGVTDDNGNVTLTLPANTTISIEVDARIRRTGALPNWNVRVQDGENANAPYTYTHGTTFNSSVGSAQTINIPLGINAAGTSGDRDSGPFAILDSIYTAIQGVLAVSPNANFPELLVDWGSQAQGTFFSGGGGTQRIALLADLTEDTDEFDQHVIAHEFGHYIEFNFSRADNIGGSHTLGDELDPRVAFGEGFGYAFAAMMLNDPDARDSFFGDITPNDGVTNPVHASGGFNIEANPSAANACWCSESSVWSMLYDLYDNTNDGNDTLSLGLQPLWNVLIDEQRDTPAFTTIFSFITALKAAQPASATAINTLVAAQNIDAATMNAFASTETHFPSNVPQAAALPVYTTATIGGGPLVLRSVNDAGYTNKLSNRRFVRFDTATTRDVTITLSSSNPSANRDPDFLVWKAGAFVRDGTDPPTEFPETETFQVTPGTYVVEIYDCANGCNPTEPEDGVGSGDFDLTLTIN